RREGASRRVGRSRYSAIHSSCHVVGIGPCRDGGVHVRAAGRNPCRKLCERRAGRPSAAEHGYSGTGGGRGCPTQGRGRSASSLPESYTQHGVFSLGRDWQGEGGGKGEKRIERFH